MILPLVTRHSIFEVSGDIKLGEYCGWGVKQHVGHPSPVALHSMLRIADEHSGECSLVPTNEFVQRNGHVLVQSSVHVGLSLGTGRVSIRSVDFSPTNRCRYSCDSPVQQACIAAVGAFESSLHLAMKIFAMLPEEV